MTIEQPKGLPPHERAGRRGNGRHRASLHPEPSQPIPFSVVHDKVPGRLRIAAPSFFRRPEIASEIADRLGKIDLIRAVSVSSHTGRVLLTFDAGLTHAAVLAHIAAVLAPSRPGNRTRQGGALEHPPDRGQKPASRARTGGVPLKEPATPAVGERVNGSAKQAGSGKSASTWHAMQREDVIAALATHAGHGLRNDTALRRLKAYGHNMTPGRPRASELATLGRQFMSLPVGLLIGASVVSIMTGGVVDAVVTLAVVGLNAAIGYGTESGSERIIRSMTERQPHAVPVLRDGKETLLNYDRLVPGDILVLRPGIVIAADARVIDGDGLLINEALLTGESEPAEKSADHICSQDETLPDRANMVHAGSFVVTGRGRAVVVATGSKTETGRIEAAAQAVSTPQTPLERDLQDLGSKLAVVSLIACGAFIGTGYLTGRPLSTIFRSAVALAVAAIPEGLPTTATTTLALGLRQLRRKGVIVRRLEAVEGLGSLQVICFDKTGTLTENNMRVDRVHLGADGDLAEAGFAKVPQSFAASYRRLLEIGALCSEVKLETTHEGLTAIGTPTETALVKRAMESGLDPAALRKSRPLVRLQYRTETDRYMASFHKGDAPNEAFLAVKGDPQQVLSKCAHLMEVNGSIVPLDSGLRRQIMRTNNDLAGRGLRVLGFAYAEETEKSLDDGRLIWIGAAGLKDPVARGAKELVARLHQAGIRPIMITGDQAATAKAIAAEIGLGGNGPLSVLDSADLDRLQPDVLSAIAKRTHVFARVPPTKKLRIVEALRQSGLTVGMTGDGFNDAPALKAANIAIAVGRDSATAARDVADVIVSENDLMVIADGIEQGRTILSNIRKSVHYMVSTNLSEILVLLAESVRRNDVLESPMELLWLNLVTDILPGLGLALEPPERLVMSRPPRIANQSLLSVRDLRHAVLESGVIASSVLGAHVYGLAKYGPGPHTRTVTFMSLVASQLLHALACRHDRFEPLGGRALFGNPVLNAALLGSATLQALPFASGTLMRLLGISRVRPTDLAVAGLAGLAAFAANEAILAYRTGKNASVGAPSQKVRARTRKPGRGTPPELLGSPPCAISY